VTFAGEEERAAMTPENPPDLPSEAGNAFAGIDAKPSHYRGGGWRSKGRWRVMGAANAESHCYHVMSRTCSGTVQFDETEKEAFQRLMWKMSAFLGIEVLTYCVMGNHFHVLAEVPNKEHRLQRFEGTGGEEALLKHLATFYSRVFMHDLRTNLQELRRMGCEGLVQERLKAFKRRFCDLSIWGKEIKERFGRWYNQRHGRKGALWMERFKSVLVENGEALKTMAAYIDLNPVRAMLVEDPRDYRWCGYAEALSGDTRARQGMCKVMGAAIGQEGIPWDKPVASGYGSVADSYRMWLFDEGRERTDRTGAVVKRGFSEEASREVTRVHQGRLGTAELLRHRVRHFTQGLALGSREWIESLFEAHRENFGTRRKTGARRLREAEAPLFALRDLSTQPRDQQIPP
jgi:putative transposase